MKTYVPSRYIKLYVVYIDCCDSVIDHNLTCKNINLLKYCNT